MQYSDVHLDLMLLVCQRINVSFKLLNGNQEQNLIKYKVSPQDAPLSLKKTQKTSIYDSISLSCEHLQRKSSN